MRKSCRGVFLGLFGFVAMVANLCSAQDQSDSLAMQFSNLGYSVNQNDGVFVVPLSTANGDGRFVMFGPIAVDGNGNLQRELALIEAIPAGINPGAVQQMLQQQGLNAAVIPTDTGMHLLSVSGNVPAAIDISSICQASGTLHQVVGSVIQGGNPVPAQRLPVQVIPPQWNPVNRPDVDNRLNDLRREEQRLRSESQLCERYYREWQSKSDAEFNNSSEFHSPSVLPSIYANSWFGQWKTAELQLNRVQEEIADLERGR